ncbi:hypothetical protein KY289_024254 [Solanum tuberosum]|nr:hypothetical protein KY289_024254 [Solanum tuberosum]
MEHLPIHLVDEIRLGGPNHLRWMYSTERKMCKFKGLVRNRCNLEACIAEGFNVEEFLIFGFRYLHDGVKTPFSRYRTEDDEDVEKEGDDLSLMFPKLGHPVGNGKKKKGETFTMDLELSCGVHRYVLFNTGDEQVEAFIKEHKMLIDSNIRSNAWTRARSHSQEFGNWFKEKVKNVEVPNQVTLSATTDSFASARDQNPIDGEVIYYGTIQDIIEAEMEKLQSRQSEDDNQLFDTFTAVMGHEHPRSMRLYGRGVTKKELEERMHQRMAEKLEQQKVTIHQEVADDILGRLNRMYPGLQLNAAMLASMGSQSPQEAMQPLNRPSSSKNNQALKGWPIADTDELGSSSLDLADLKNYESQAYFLLLQIARNALLAHYICSISQK